MFQEFILKQENNEERPVPFDINTCILFFNAKCNVDMAFWHWAFVASWYTRYIRYVEIINTISASDMHWSEMIQPLTFPSNDG